MGRVGKKEKREENGRSKKDSRRMRDLG